MNDFDWTTGLTNGSGSPRNNHFSRGQIGFLGRFFSFNQFLAVRFRSFVKGGNRTGLNHIEAATFQRPLGILGFTVVLLDFRTYLGERHNLFSG